MLAFIFSERRVYTILQYRPGCVSKRIHERSCSVQFGMMQVMKKSSTLWWIIGIIILIGILFAWSGIAAHQKGAGQTTREVALSCTTDAATTFHIHPHLEININGEAVVVPADIGITNTCMHPIHTHDTTGTIHIESPVQRDFTLGDFFAVWDKPFSKDQILDFKADATHTITVTVDDKPVDTFENTVLHDNDRIVISYSGR